VVALGLAAGAALPIAASQIVEAKPAVMYPGSCQRSLGTSSGSTRCLSGSGNYRAQVRCVNYNGYVDYRYGGVVSVGWWSTGYCRSGYRATAVATYVTG
jgi:hypothetical protein